MEVAIGLPVHRARTKQPVDLSAADRLARIREILDPYQDRIADLPDARDTARRPSVLVATHSVTPSFLGKARPWYIGLRYNRHARLVNQLRHALGRVVADDRS